MDTITADRDLLARLALVDPSAVASTRTLSGRALCTEVVLHDGTQLFVKQDRPGRVDSDAAAEAANVRRLRAAGLIGATPELLAAEPGAAVYRGYQHLPTLHRRAELGASASRALGRALAELHRTDADLAPTGPLARSTLDWITVTPRSLTMHPAGYREVWARAGEARGPLLSLARGWRASAVIHGDIKADNVMLARQPVRAILLDWETAGVGDPLWDLGCAVGDRVWAWLDQLPLDPGASLAQWLADSPTPLESVSADARALLDGYAAPADPTLVASYAGAFLLQRAVAFGLSTVRLPARGLLTVHLATQFLTDPERIAEILL